MNIFMGIGRITKKPELRYTTKEVAVARFTLAINRDTKNKEGNYDTDFISCVAYGKTAELIDKYLDKGSAIAIEGKIQTGSYEKDNQKVYTTDVVVDKMNFIGTKKETTPEETKEETQTEIVQKAMNDNPYEAMGKQVEADFELPF